MLVANGYGSVNGSAQLLRLNANSGALVNAIDMGVTGSNGLSSPAVWLMKMVMVLLIWFMPAI